MKKEITTSTTVGMKVFTKNKVELTKWVCLWEYFGLAKWYDLISNKSEIRLFGILIK